jgi:preprotein translocase subunit SecE
MSSLVNFVKGSYLEFTQKVEWPKWDELRSSTIVVSVATIILAIFLFGVDEIFSKAIRNIIQILVNLFN